jgi:transcriptional regulator with XRE-family HTH domain
MIISKKITIIDHKATGLSFRKERTQKRISLREMARRLKISAPYLSDLERGNRNWSEELAGKYLEALKEFVKKEKGGF